MESTKEFTEKEETVTSQLPPEIPILVTLVMEKIVKLDI